MDSCFRNCQCMKQFSFLIITFSLIFLLRITTFSSASDEVEDESGFSYSEGTGKGPKEWGKFDPHWQVCNNGKMQSPIDFLDKRVQVSSELGKLRASYRPARAAMKNRGHDVAVFWKGDAGKFRLNETEYVLEQCHWHSPSEHTFNGSRYQLELHLVHKSSQGDVAVIGIVYKYGRPDPFLSKLLPRIKSLAKEGETSLGIVNPPDINFGRRKYYRYVGSLTVPPCTEGVVWTIVKKVRTVSREQVRSLREAVHDGFKANSRPIQWSDGRKVYMYRPRGDGTDS